MSIRQWSVRHSLLMETIYTVVKFVFIRIHPLLDRIGYARVEKPMAFVEKRVKGFLFNCQMCGDCYLSESGMSCPMNCPKNLTNGPCGGVRDNGNCEVDAGMKCVWVEAWEGSQHMKHGKNILLVQNPVNFRIQGSSSWLRMTKKAVNLTSAKEAV
ncbi:MAG: methylenetetrahydrofolate reductase C-terminal domain-containing protein [SAR324 cluster bacterium]|nr:methylenetetrahydrofolate reductase C-terminal domain-containing protein [SAR324 cluster bacterium]